MTENKEIEGDGIVAAVNEIMLTNSTSATSILTPSETSTFEFCNIEGKDRFNIYILYYI